MKKFIRLLQNLVLLAVLGFGMEQLGAAARAGVEVAEVAEEQLGREAGEVGAQAAEREGVELAAKRDAALAGEHLQAPEVKEPLKPAGEPGVPAAIAADAKLANKAIADAGSAVQNAKVEVSVAQDAADKFEEGAAKLQAAGNNAGQDLKDSVAQLGKDADGKLAKAKNAVDKAKNLGANAEEKAAQAADKAKGLGDKAEAGAAKLQAGAEKVAGEAEAVTNSLAKTVGAVVTTVGVVGAAVTIPLVLIKKHTGGDNAPAPAEAAAGTETEGGTDTGTGDTGDTGTTDETGVTGETGTGDGTGTGEEETPVKKKKPKKTKGEKGKKGKEKELRKIETEKGGSSKNRKTAADIKERAKGETPIEEKQAEEKPKKPATKVKKVLTKSKKAKKEASANE